MYLIRTVFLQIRNSALKSALFLLASLIILSCSSSTRTLFFDIPPAKPKIEETDQAQPETGPKRSQTINEAFLQHPHDREGDRPPIEDITNWEDALVLLPKDDKGKPDWVQALEPLPVQALAPLSLMSLPHLQAFALGLSLEPSL